MTMNAPALEIIKLWPSVFLEADLPGYEAPTQRVIALAESHPEYTLRPDPGTLLLWHSSLNHLVHPNGSEQTRISISFNIVREWANHYVSDL